MLRRIGFLIGAGDWSEAEVTLRDAGATIIATVGVAARAAPARQVSRRGAAQLGQPALHALPRARGRAGTGRRCARRAPPPRPRSRASARRGWPGARASTNRSRTSPPAVTRRRCGGSPSIRRRAVTRDDLALAGVVRSYIALDSGRLDEVAPRYREMVDLLEQSRDSGALVPVRAAQPAMRHAVDARAGAPLRRRRAAPSRRKRRRRCARSRWRARRGATSGRATSTPRSRPPGLAEADARWLGPPPNVRLALYSVLAVLFAMLGRRSDSYGALDEILVLFDDPGGGYRRDSPFYAFYRLFAVRLADWHDDGARVERLAGELDRLASADTGMLRPLLQAQRLVLPGRLAWQRGQWREAPRRVRERARARGGPARVRRRRRGSPAPGAGAACDLADVDAAAAAIAPVVRDGRARRLPGRRAHCDPRASSTRSPPRAWSGRLAAGADRGACGAGPLCLKAPAAAADADPAPEARRRAGRHAAPARPPSSPPRRSARASSTCSSSSPPATATS